MGHVFQHLGLDYIISNNGLQGYKHFMRNEGHFDIIITDLRMPVFSGQEMITKIRKYELKNQRSSKIPIIVVTGEADENEQSRCLNTLGAHYFINKPINFDTLYGALISLLTLSEGELEEIKENEEKISIKMEENIKLPKRVKHIIVIEDDTFLNTILTQFLQSADFMVDQCYSKSEVRFIYIYILNF